MKYVDNDAAFIVKLETFYKDIAKSKKKRKGHCGHLSYPLYHIVKSACKSVSTLLVYQCVTNST